MSPVIQTPPGRDVTVRNNQSFIYIEGDAFTDGSLRFLPDPDSDRCSIEIRKSGVFQPTGLNLDGSTLFLAKDLSLSAQGSQLNIQSIEDASQELTLGVEFDDAGSDVPKTPILGQRINNLVVQPIFSSQLITKIDSNTFTAQIVAGNAYRYTFYFKSGTLAATSPVTLVIVKGPNENGEIFFSQIIPTSQWIANSDISVALEGGLSITPGNTFTTTLSSDNDFSLLGDFATGGGRYFAFDVQPFIFETLISTPEGTDRFLFNITALSIIDNLGNIILSGEQVSQTGGTLGGNNVPEFVSPLDI